MLITVVVPVVGTVREQHLIDKNRATPFFIIRGSHFHSSPQLFKNMKKRKILFRFKGEV